MPDMKSVIDHFETAFDWPEAENSGRILPREGVDSDFDAASAVISEVEGKLDAYLEEQRAHFGDHREVFILIPLSFSILDSIHSLFIRISIVLLIVVLKQFWFAVAYDSVGDSSSDCLMLVTCRLFT